MASPETRSITISCRSSCQGPVVYVVGSFTNPPWDIRYELLGPNRQDDDTTATFSKTFDLPVGEWQYKFVTESGKWFCDESAEIGN